MIHLEWLVNEFLAVTEYLQKLPEVRKDKGYLIVNKNSLEVLLDKNKFETAHNKLLLWKRLHWIDSEPERVTKRVYDREAGKQIHVVKIDLGVYRELKKLDVK